jgi:hypothetical protein
MLVEDELVHALELERTSGILSRRWLDEGGPGSAVYDILARHAEEDDRHAQTLWGLLVDLGIAPPETPEVETPEDFPEALLLTKEELVALYDRTIPAVSGRERPALQRLRTEDDDQRALLRVYFPTVGGRI